MYNYLGGFTTMYAADNFADACQHASSHSKAKKCHIPFNNGGYIFSGKVGVHLIDAPFSSLLITVTVQTWME
jgi:hypothetical protein